MILLSANQADNWLYLPSLAPTGVIGGGVTVTSIVQGGVYPACGNSLCEFGERCNAESTSPYCCPSDCTAPLFGTWRVLLRTASEHGIERVLPYLSATKGGWAHSQLPWQSFAVWLSSRTRDGCS